jgi:hypothetical protein
MEQQSAHLVRQLLNRDIPLLKLGMKGPVSALMSQASGLVHQKSRRVALVQEDDIENQDEQLDNACEVFGPPPPKTRLDHERCSDDRAKNRTQHDRHGICGYGNASL